MRIAFTFSLSILITIIFSQFSSATFVAATSGFNYDVNNAVGTTGPQSVVVILVEFKDLRHQKNKDEVKKAIFVDLNKYIKEASYDSTRIVGDITDWVKLPFEASEYGRDFGTLIDVESRRLFQDAVREVDTLIDFRQYNHIMIVHAGKGQETTSTPGDIWSAYLSVNPPVYADGLVLRNVIVVPEREAEDINPLGVYAHEFMHSLGLPDLYPDIILMSKYMGLWDVMDTGLRNGQPRGSSPSHPSSWSKITLGWPIKTRTVYTGSVEKITIAPLEILTQNIQVVILPSTPGQYYLIEARFQRGFDSYLPSKGVLITEVDERRPTGSGMVKVINANSSAPDLKKAVFNVGQVFNDASRLTKVSVISENNGFTLLIDRRIATKDSYNTTSMMLTPFTNSQDTT